MKDIPSTLAGGRHFQILSLDGGGYKGMFSAAVLAAIEEDLDRPIIQHFDLIVGTSTGGIIALGLGAGLRPSEIVAFYTEWGSRIFPYSRLRTLAQIWRPKYDPASLREALGSVLGEKTLAESAVPLVIPAFDLSANQVYLFKTPHNQRLRRDGRERMVDVALATAAAPSYFPALNLREVRLVDGGLWANNPVLVGIAEAISLFQVPLEIVQVFSLGTTSDLDHHHTSLDQGGLWQWARRAVPIIMRAQSVGAAGLAEHLLSPERLLRHDPAVPPDVLKMDRVDTRTLMGLARSSSRHIAPQFETRFGSHLGRRPTLNKNPALGVAP